MHLNAQLFEDARGGRSVQVALKLHGAVAWPSGPVASWTTLPPSKLVDAEARPLGTQVRELANLDLLAADEADEDHVDSVLGALRDAVSAAEPGTWVEHEGVAARLLIASRTVAEKDAILAELLEAARVRLRRRSGWTPLRVLRIELQDFRIVEKLVLALPTLAPAVLVGANGSGKSTLLDAMVILLGHLEAGIRGAAERPAGGCSLPGEPSGARHPAPAPDAARVRAAGGVRRRPRQGEQQLSDLCGRSPRTWPGSSGRALRHG